VLLEERDRVADAEDLIGALAGAVAFVGKDDERRVEAAGREGVVHAQRLADRDARIVQALNDEERGLDAVDVRDR
jgi:hypothetical protein